MWSVTTYPTAANLFEPENMSFAVSKSQPMLIRPPSTEPMEKMKLSSWDRCFAGFPVTALLIFDGAIQQPAVEAVKKGLAQALVHYYPVAGRLAVGGGGDDELHIACTGEGVPFVAASADCALEDSGLLEVPFAMDMLDDLAVYYDAAEGCRADDPLLLMQVTEFSCGGFVVGVTWNHVLADGVGMAQFLQAVGELTRGLTAPSVVPIRDGGASLPLLSSSVVAAKQCLILKCGGEDLTYLDITVPSALISRIKSDFAAVHSGAGERCTTFEAVIAVLWQCRTRAIGSDPDTPLLLAFSVNLRKHVGIKAGYYANCSVGQISLATSGEVAGGDITDVVKLIKRAKENVAELLDQDGGDEEEDMSEIAEEELASLFGYDSFVVSSWRNIGFDAPDFGGGTAARVAARWHQSPILRCVALLPCRTKDGENVQTHFVREEHADAFLAELDKLCCP